MNPLRGAISGYGEVAAQAHLFGWRTRPGVNLVVVHDPVAARRHQAIKQIRNVRVYDDLELMLDGEALDFVDIASPPVFHAMAARMALEAGAHVLVEKPLCLKLDEFDELVALARKRSRVLMCVHNWSFAPAYQRAHELLRAGRLGELRYLSLTRLRAQPAGAAGSERWRLDPATGGGILIDHGWHVFYLMQWLAGALAPTAISAQLARQGGAAVDDRADLRVEFGADCLAHGHLSWRSGVRRTSAVMSGERALIEIEGDRVALVERDGIVEDYSVSDAADDSYHASWFAGVAAQFEAAIAEGHDGPIATANQAAARTALALIVGARQSAATGMTVKLTDLA